MWPPHLGHTQLIIEEMILSQLSSGMVSMVLMVVRS